MSWSWRSDQPRLTISTASTPRNATAPYFQRAGQNRDELEPSLAWRVGVIALARGEFKEVHALIRRSRLAREDTLEQTRVLALSASPAG